MLAALALDSTGEHQDQQNQHDQPDPAAWTVPPTATVRPRGDRTEHHQHRKNNQNRDHASP